MTATRSRPRRAEDVPSRRRVLVVGGGITGLACAYEILERARVAGIDIDVTVFEKSARVGGSLVTERRGGFVLDGGPDSWVSAKPHAAELARKLGLGQELMGTTEANRHVYIASGNELFLMPEGMMLGIPTEIGPLARTPLFSWEAKLRMALEPLIPVRHFHGDEDESVGAFLSRRLGDEVTERLAGPLLGGIFAGDPYEISVRAAFPQLVEAEQKYGSLIQAMRARRRAQRDISAHPPSLFQSLHGGMARFAEVLTERLAPHLSLGRGITAVTLENGRYAVEMEGGGVERGDDVVLAVPAYVSARAVRSLDAELARSFDLLMGYVSSATVFLAFRRHDVDHPLDASGFLVPRSAGKEILAGTWISSKWAHRAPEGHVLMRAFLGGTGRENVLERDDDALVALVLRDLRTLIPIGPSPLFARVFRFHRASPQPHLGHLGRMRRLRATMARFPGLYAVSNAFEGIGIPDCIRQASNVAAQIVPFVKTQ